MMASVLKRKRGPAEVAASPKRAKSVTKSKSSAPVLDSQTGWDAAFGSIKRQDEPEIPNGLNDVSITAKYASPEAEDYQEVLTQHQVINVEKEKRKHEAVETASSQWKISEPIGGRMIDVDPVFTEDEKFIIVAHRKTIKVYSTSNSLLNRSITLPFDPAREPIAHIVSYALSKVDSNILWVASSDGSIYRVDWTSGEGWDRTWNVSQLGITYMTVASMNSNERVRDVLFTCEEQDEGWRISAHELSVLGKSTTTQSRIIYTSPNAIQMMKTSPDGDVIVAASGERILLGALRSMDFGTVDKIRYEFRVFESTDFISSLDVRVSKRSSNLGRKASKTDKLSVVDVVVGDVKGAIFVHNDLLANLIRSQNPSADGPHQINLIPRKLHWHRKSVQSLKWSLDGNYIISGGSETVLVLWQLDTGRQQFLPHLSAAIQNVVVSPHGTSYAIHLGDNSTMILSTTELVPTANIAGIQAHVAGAFSHSKPRVWRLEDENNGRPLIPRTPAVINPAHPSRLLLAVGEIQEVNPRSKSVLSAPYLQTYDIASNHNLTRQALTRTNVTNKNIAPNAHSISEPVISHMQISHDGSWLATVDEFIPPRRDIDFLAHSGMDLDIEQRRRREVFLKFWQWSKADETWALVTRIDAPHMMAIEKYGAGRVLALSVDSSSLTFSTLGEDGIVQIWRPRVRKRDGVVVRGKDGEALCTWSCHRRVSLGIPEIEDNTQSFIPSHGSLAFSEDGSILAAAIDGMDKGLVHLINPFTGMIRASQPAVYSGDLISMAFISQYIITLSDELQVYDLVLNERKYGITLGYIKTLLDANQKKEMFHLSVDPKSKTFAIAIPCREDWNPEERKQIGTLQMAYSEIAVFDPKYPVPIYTKRSSSLATALLPAISSPGFVVLDAAAEITTISPKATQTLTSLARPMVELRLDIAAEEEPAIDLMQLADETEEMDAVDEEEIGPAADVAPIDPDDDGPPVISQQRLTEVLDIGPSFALPPVEQMFYHVADLFSSKPVGQAAS